MSTHAHTETAAAAGPSIGGIVVRMILTLVGAAGMVAGAFLTWVRGLEAVNLDWRALIRPTVQDERVLWQTVGFVVVAVAILAILGLAPRTGWLTGLAGALGIVTVLLFGIQLVRDAGRDVVQVSEAGVWVTLAGAVLAVVGSFFGSRPRVETSTETHVTDRRAA